MHDLPQFLLFIHQLPTILKSRPKVSSFSYLRVAPLFINWTGITPRHQLRVISLPNCYTEPLRQEPPPGKSQAGVCEGNCIQSSYCESFLPSSTTCIYAHLVQCFLLLQIVVTSQLATKMVNADGSPGTFDSGARGVVLPQLGMFSLNFTHSGWDDVKVKPMLMCDSVLSCRIPSWG